MWRNDDSVGYDGKSFRGDKNCTGGNFMHDYQYYDGFDNPMMYCSPNPNLHSLPKGEKGPNESSKNRKEKLERILGSRLNQSVMNQSINVDPDVSNNFTEYFDEPVNQSVTLPSKRQENKSIIQTFTDCLKDSLSTNMLQTKRRKWLEKTDETIFPSEFTILCADDN